MGWDQPFSPLDSGLPTDPDIITLLFFPSSPPSAAVLSDQPPNPLVDNFIQSSTDNPIRLTDNAPAPQHESRANLLLPSLFDSLAHFNNTQLAEPQSTPPFPRQQPSNSKALIAPSQDAPASLSRPNRFQSKRIKQPREEINKERDCREAIMSTPDPSFFSIKQISSSGIWKHRHYLLETNVIEVRFRHSLIFYLA